MIDIFSNDKKFKVLLRTAFVVLSVGFTLSGYLYFNNYKKEYATNIVHQLTVVSELKVGELLRWRKERFNDALMFHDNPEFSILVKKYWSDTNNVHLENRIKFLMNKIYDAEEYDAIFLLDSSYRKRIFVPAVHDRIFSLLSQQSIDSIKAGKTVFEDFYYNEQSKKIFLKIIVPLFAASSKSISNGIVVLRIDPDKSLYTIIHRWPSDSKSGETLLIRREGNEVVFVNQLRFKDHAALQLRYDITKNPNLLAVKAVLGQEGIIEGIDYRGVEVMSYIQSVPGTPWFMITKMDQSEIYESYNERKLIIGLTIFLLVLSAGAFVGSAIKQLNVKTLSTQVDIADVLRKNEERFRTIVENTGEGIGFVNAEEQFLFCNKAAEEIFGVAPGTLVGMNVHQFVSESQYTVVQHETTERRQGNKSVYELDIVRPNGEQRTIIITAVPQFEKEKGYTGSYGVFRDITERNISEKMIQESERQYRSLYNNTPVMLHSIDSRGMLISVSEYWLTTLGYDREDVLGKKSSEFLTAESRTYASEVVLPEFMKTGYCNNIEYQFVKKNGEVIDTLLSAIAEKDSNGKTVRSIAVIIDITKRKQLEDELKKSKEIFQGYFEMGSIGTCVTSPEKGWIEVNDRLCQMLGYTKDELSQCTWAELTHPGDLDIDVDLFNQVIEKKRDRYELDKRFIRKDGVVVFTTLNVSCQRNADGSVNQFLASLLDITKRKRAEEALKESEQKFRTLYETMTEGVALHEMIYDGDKAVDYRIIDINPAYEKHTGLSQSKARGLLASELYGTGTPPYFDEYAGVAFTGTPIAFETFFPPLDRHFHIGVISPGKGLFATVFEDITDRKRKEEELQEKNSELERFTYTVSHDLKSPLITIKGFSGGLLKDVAQGRHDRIATDLKRINDAADKMSGLLNDLLELSRIGRIVNPPSDVIFETLAHEVVTLLSGSIAHRKAKVVVQDGLPVVHADRRRLFEVLQNLVENALKFTTEQSEPLIEIGMRSDNGEQVFFVRDNGKGIDPRYHETIFGLFNKLDASTEGTGIGLALARRIIEVHGGRIWVESEGTHRGSTFCFTLPEIQSHYSRKEKTS